MNLNERSQPMSPKKLQCGLIFIVLSIGLVLGTRFDAFLYTDPVAQVTAVKIVTQTKTEDSYQNTDHIITQRLTLKLLNGTQKKHKIFIKNSYARSQAVEQRYRVGQQVLLSLDHHERPVLKGLKRDTFIVFLFCLTVGLILLSTAKKAPRVFLGLVGNTLLFLLAIQIGAQHNGAGIFHIFIGLVFLFTVVTLGLSLGWRRAFWVAAVATILTTFISFMLGLSVFKVTHEQGLHYEAMPYMIQQPRMIFLTQVLIGALGAIMDETADIVTTLQQLRQEGAGLDFVGTFKAGLDLGRQLVGPLISILFMIFMAETIPMAMIYLHNGTSIVTTFHWTMYLGVAQALISAIGIVLAIPMTSALASIFLRGRSDGCH